MGNIVEKISKPLKSIQSTDPLNYVLHSNLNGYSIRDRHQVSIETDSTCDSFTFVEDTYAHGFGYAPKVWAWGGRLSTYLFCPADFNENPDSPGLSAFGAIEIEVDATNVYTKATAYEVEPMVGEFGLVRTYTVDLLLFMEAITG